MASRTSRAVVFVAGQRTPFHPAGGTWRKSWAVDLARLAVKGLIARSGVRPTAPELIVLGTVIQEPRTSNVAREVALSALSPYTPSVTVTMACISSLQAAFVVALNISTGTITAGVAGGTETASDLPIRFSRNMRAAMLAAPKAKGPAGKLALLRTLSFGDLAPELPGIDEFSTGVSMGASSDSLAAKWGVSRADADAFALKSHTTAASAHAAGHYLHEVLALNPVQPGAPAKGPGSSTWDSTIRPSTIEKLRELKPAFTKPHGVNTPGNSSPLTDGASAILLMSSARAQAEGLPARAVLRAFEWSARSPVEELLLGPAYAIARLLQKQGLTVADISVWEIHEAFAGQVLANLNALSSPSFAWEVGSTTPPGKAVGTIPMERTNAWGGSLSLGHPFGATGTRIITTAVNRLHAEGGRFAMCSACAAGGQGVALLIEKVEEALK